MATLYDLVPDADMLLALAPEELAPFLLNVAKTNLQNGMFHPNNLTQVTAGSIIPNDSGYRQREKEVELALSEGWNWLRVQGLIVPASGMNGSNGFCVIGRRGSAIATAEDFERFSQAAAFPKAMLHGSIADKVWLNLARGDLADAVFVAFRAVEEAVRKAGGYGAADFGTDLMRRAFDAKGGPLTNMEQEKGEREALAHLFAGAIGSYKNPHSHRTVSITDTKDAQEMVVLASHLLRIVESRRGSNTTAADAGS